MFIRIQDAVKKYGDGEAMVYALDYAELELEEGKIFHFTLLLRCLLWLRCFCIFFLI